MLYLCTKSNTRKKQELKKYEKEGKSTKTYKIRNPTEYQF